MQALRAGFSQRGSPRAPQAIRLAPRGVAMRTQTLVRSALTARVDLRVAVLRLRRLRLKTSRCVARRVPWSPCRTWEPDAIKAGARNAQNNAEGAEMQEYGAPPSRRGSPRMGIRAVFASPILRDVGGLAHPAPLINR